MIENIYIDKYKIYRWSAPGIIAFLAYIMLPVFFIVKFDFFYKITMFKILGLTGYFLFLIKWIQEIILYCRLILKKDPIIQVSDNGLVFNYNKKLALIPWNHILKV